ncbi:MAG: HPr family phosphocarrier protein [Pseudomonadota bacterium]
MSDSGPVRRTLMIANARGLHARASAKFVETVSAFTAEVRVHRDGETVDGASIMGLLMLGAGRGVSIDVEAEGPQAEQAIAAIAELVDAKFYED